MDTSLLIAAMLKLEQFSHGAPIALEDFGPVLSESANRMITITDDIWDYNHKIFISCAD